MIEIEYKDQDVLAPNFKQFLKSIRDNGKSSKIIDFLLNKSNDHFNDKYRSVSCGTLDYSIQFKESENDDDKEDIKCSFTPKGKKLIKDESGVYDKKYRMDGNIGSIIKQLIEYDSSLIKCNKRKIEGFDYEIIEDLKYGFCVKNNNDFLLLDPSVEKRVEVLSKYEFKITKFTDSEYEDLVNNIKGNLSNSYVFEIVKGSDIVKYYRDDTYDRINMGGTLWNSCMKSSDRSSFIEFYAKIPECSMLILKKGNYISGRALIWDTNFGVFMDRRYTSINYLENSFIQYAKDKKWMYKTHNNFEKVSEVTAYDPTTQKYSNQNIPLIVRISNPKIKTEVKKYPYCDTFGTYHYWDDLLVNYNRSSEKHIYQIKNTGGSKGLKEICLNSLFYNKTSFNSSSERSGVVKEDLSNINIDPDLYGYPATPLVKDWEGRYRLKDLCKMIDDKYVCVFNRPSFNAFMAQKEIF